MKENKLHNIKNSGFTTPKDYFDVLEDSILAEAGLRSLSQGSGLTVPKDYFETFESAAVKNTKVIPLYRRKVFPYAVSIAVAALLILSLNVFNITNSIDNLDTATIDTYILNEIDTSDIASLFLENELTETQFINYNLTDETIDSFLENENVNDLMLE